MSRPQSAQTRRTRRRSRACPDCRPDVVRRSATHLEVRHDLSCPTFRATSGGRPFRQLLLVTTGLEVG